jgi:UDP-glucose 4-epimerase
VRGRGEEVVTDGVIVTGAAGFIGRRLCEALRARGPVTAVLRTRTSGPWDHAIIADLARDDIPPRAFDGAGVVYHLAGRAHAVAERASDVALYRSVNVDGMRRVVAAANAAGVRRVVFASSVKAMGEGGDSGGPESAYGVSKREAEDVLRAGGLPEAVVLRLSLVYGPGVEGNLGGMLRAVKSGRFPPPPRIQNRRAMVHVDDVVRVAIAAAENPAAAGQTYVIGDGVAYSTRAIYDSMRRSLGMNMAARGLPSPCWRAMAYAGDAIGAVARRRAPFDSEAYRKLFGSAWYEPSDVQTMLGVGRCLTLDDALPEMIRAL